MKTYYEYDAEFEVLVRIADSGSIKVIEKSELQWKELSPEYDQYARAIFLGQGCWERLETISEEAGDKILEEWGIVFCGGSNVKELLVNDDYQLGRVPGPDPDTGRKSRAGKH